MKRNGENMELIVRSLIVVAAMIIPGSALAGPFGIDFESDAPESLGCEEYVSAGSFKCLNVPKPLDGAKSYLVYWSENLGICGVVALGDPLINGLRDRYLGVLTEKYGEPSKNDELGITWKNAGGAGLDIELIEDASSPAISYYWTDQEKMQKCLDDAMQGPDLKEAL